MTKHELAEQICKKVGLNFSPSYKSIGSTLTIALLKDVFQQKFGHSPEATTKHGIAAELFEQLGLNFVEKKYTSTGSTLVQEYWEDLYNAL